MPVLSKPRADLRRPRPPRVVVLGDLALDVVLTPERPLESGTDVPGRVALRQGGSAANTARALGRLGVRTSLVAAVGRDSVGRALATALRSDGVTVRAIRVAGRPTGRIGVLVAPGGERSFVADRGAADTLGPDDLRATWFAHADLLHLPAYSLLGEPLGLAGRHAIRLAREGGALVSLDLASIGPLLARGRRAARSLVAEVAADVLFATESEAEALLGRYRLDDLLAYTPLAVVKQGGRGATVLARRAGTGEQIRFEVATRPMSVSDTTGAGDAFDAGFVAAWLPAARAGGVTQAALRRAVLSGHRAAGRVLRAPRPELSIG